MGRGFVELLNHELTHAVTQSGIEFAKYQAKFNKVQDALNTFRMESYDLLDDRAVDRLNPEVFNNLSKNFP